MRHPGTFFIGDLAERSGVSRDTIRYYESAGILPEPPRSGSGYRLYTPEDVERLGFVDQAKALGLTLAEIAEILEIVEEGRSPCPEVLHALDERLEDTRRRIRQLESLESTLSRTLSRVRDVGAGRGGASRCPIIEGSTAAGHGTQAKT